MAREQKKLSMFDRYVIYRDEKWAGRDLIVAEAAEDLLEDPDFFSDHWRANALMNQAVEAVLGFEKKIRKKGTAAERVHVLRPSKPEVHEHTEEEANGWHDTSATAAMSPPKMQHVQAEAHTVTGEEWIGRLERAKEQAAGQSRELKRLWGLMQKELKSLPTERKKVEKHFRHDHAFQLLLNIDGIEEE